MSLGNPVADIALLPQLDFSAVKPATALTLWIPNVLSNVSSDSAVIPNHQLLDCSALPLILVVDEPSCVSRP